MRAIIVLRAVHLQGNKEAESKFQEVSQAYDTLRDPEKRAVYDQVPALHPFHDSDMSP